MLKVLYSGYGGNRYQAERLFPIIHKLGMKLVIISEWEHNPSFPEIEYIKWDRNTWLEEYKKCDIAIAPQRLDKQPAKSNVKVSQYMACGLPVVAAALEAYKPLIEHRKNGYLIEYFYDEEKADDHITNVAYYEQWEIWLERMRDDEDYRKQFVERSFTKIIDYSCEAITNKWVEFINKFWSIDNSKYDWNERKLA